MKRLRAVFLALASLAAIVASGAHPSRAEGSIDPHETPHVGPEAVKQVFSELGRVNNEALQQYVDAVGQRVARAAPRIGNGYRFYVVDQWTPNAFALPDGSIFVSRGLVALASSEDELATVLGHEITHVTERHAIGRQAIEQSANPFLIGFARAAYLASFSRDQERDADIGGQSLAATAGYDPRSMSEFLRKLEYAERLQFGASRIPNFFDTHPSTAERAAATYDRGSKLPFRKLPGFATDTADYVRHLEGLVIGDDPAQGIFRGTRFVHPDMGFTIYFPDGWTPVNTPEAVGAFDPQNQARIALELAGDGDDPQKIGQTYLAKHAKEMKEMRPVIESEAAITISGRPAYEVIATMPSQAGALVAQLDFVAFGGKIFLLSTVARSTSFKGYRGRATATIRSLRPLEPEERTSIAVMRLRSATADEGESLAELSRRARNALDLQRLAVANGLFTETELHAGQVLKVAVSEPYRAGDPSPPKPDVAAPLR